MKIIISPAKKMNNREDELETAGLPCFLSEAEKLKEYIRGLSFEEARALWGCNEAIARLNTERFASMDLRRRLTPALLSYEGLQYQYMAPGVFDRGQWSYAQEHLRILSGFYGILRPLDGIVPYRLEMQAKADFPEGAENLYEFWGAKLYEALRRKEGEHCVILNLASKEYSRAVEPYLKEGDSFISCIFGTKGMDKNGKTKIRVKATEAKMARGEMVRFLAEQGGSEPEAAKGFDRLGYGYSEADSAEGEMVFLKG